MKFALFLVGLYEYLMYYYQPINQMYYEPWKFTFENVETNFDVKHIIAVDFDDTIAYTNFPTIISAVPYAIEVLQILSKDPRFVLILWTCREGEYLDEAINFCELNDIHFDYINENDKELINLYGNDCRKVGADIYIDDKSPNINIEKLWEDWYEWIEENCE